MKSTMLNESYFLMPVDGGKAQSFMRGTLAADGHPMISANRKWMILDEYPYPNGKTPLMMVDMKTQTRTDLITFDHDIGSSDTDIKCDLHPRWDRKHKAIGVDATEQGRRCFTIVDVSDLLKERI